MYFKWMVRTIFLYFLLTNATWAGNLCDANCTLTISFPTGGSIEAIDDLTITFGASGLVDTVGSVTAYMNGETLTLNSGDKLVFGNGGIFDIGSAGNIDFTNLMIITTGIIWLEAIGGTETVIVPMGGTLSVFGAPGWNIDTSVISILGSIELSAGGKLSLFNSVASGCLFTNSPGTAISISSFSVTVTPDNSACLSIVLGATVMPISTDPTVISPTTNPPATDTNESGSGALSLNLLLIFLPLLTFSAFRKTKSMG